MFVVYQDDDKNIYIIHRWIYPRGMQFIVFHVAITIVYIRNTIRVLKYGTKVEQGIENVNAFAFARVFFLLKCMLAVEWFSILLGNEITHICIRIYVQKK